MEPHFFQLLDRIRFEAALGAIARDGKSVAVISTVQALAEHYKEALIERLQQELPQARIKSFFPADTDAILESFNKVAQGMPVDRARAAPAAGQAMELWVVHDAAALPAGEVQMMLNLLEKFPGAHVRALLVFAGVQMAPEGMDGFEKSLMKWQIDRPSLDQIKESLSRVTDPERQAEVRDLVSRMAPGSTSKPAAAAPAAQTPEGTAGAASKPAQPAKAGQPAAAEKRRRAPMLITLGLAVLLMVISAGVAAWLNPEAVSQLFESSADKSPATATAPSASAPAEAASATAAASAEPVASGPEGAGASAAASNASDATPKEPAKDSPKEVAKESLKETVQEIPVQAPLTPAAALLEGQKWARQFKRGSYVVQHAYHSTFAKAQEHLVRFPNLTDAKVVPQYEEGQTRARFALISGPFDSKKDAEAFIKTENMPKESWVRTGRAIQERLVPNSEEAAKP